MAKLMIRIEKLGNGRYIVDATGQQARTFATYAEAGAEAATLLRIFPGSQISHLRDRP